MKAAEAQAALEAQKVQQAKAKAAELAQRQAADAVLDTVSDEELEELTYVYPAWEVGVAYEIDHKVRYQGVLYKVIQSHTSQADWTPDTVPALFARFRTPTGGAMEWVAGEQVNVGDQRTYQGTTYTVLQAHTTQAGWEPPNVPALWAPA